MLYKVCDCIFTNDLLYVPEHDDVVDVHSLGYPRLPGVRELVVREQEQVEVIPQDLGLDQVSDAQLAFVLGLEVLGQVGPPECPEVALPAPEVDALEVARVQVVEDGEVLGVLEGAVVAAVVPHRTLGVHHHPLEVGQVVSVVTAKEF